MTVEYITLVPDDIVKLMEEEREAYDAAIRSAKRGEYENTLALWTKVALSVQNAMKKTMGLLLQDELEEGEAQQIIEGLADDLTRSCKEIATHIES